MKITNLKCPSCGGKLEPTKNNPKIVECEFCKSQFMVEEDQAINYHIHQYPSGTPQESQTRNDSVNSGLIAGVLVAFLAVVVGAGFFAGSLKTKTQERTTVTSSTRSTTEEQYDNLKEEEEELNFVLIASPLYQSMTEAMFGKSIDRITEIDLQKVKYLSLTSGRETCAVEYSFQDPYQDENFKPITLTLQAADWNGDNFAFFSGLTKLDISDTWDYGSLNSLTELKGLVCSRLELSEVAKLVASPQQLIELGIDGVDSLEGIGIFENLEVLHIEGVVSPDFKQLVPLKQLKVLSVEEDDYDSILSSGQQTGLTDYGALSVLISLEQLEVESSSIRELSFLKSLDNLTQLSLIGTDAISLEPLGELTQLTSLKLEDNNSIQDYSPIKFLTGLKTLILDKGTSQEDLDLSGLSGLESLEMSGFMSISFLKNMGNLKHLSIHGCNIDEANAMSGLTGLETLACYSVWTYAVPLRDVAFIDNMPNLKSLDFSGISQDGGWGGYQRNIDIMGDISNVFNHQGLEELYLNNCMFELNFGRLKENPSLKKLEMREVNLQENFYVESSQGMTNVWYDDVSLDAHTDFLTKYPGLEELYLDGNQLTNINFASSLKNLTHLGLNNNYITELSPLNQAENLKYLDIRMNPISSTIETDENVQILR